MICINGFKFFTLLSATQVSKLAGYPHQRTSTSRSVRKGIREVLVRWRGYPARFDNWVAESSVKKYKAMDADHFYVTLFSDASVNCYPVNTLTAFTVVLSLPIVHSASERWEVVLCKFSCVPVAKSELVRNTYAFIYSTPVNGQIGRASCRERVFQPV
jgi:hypothetical protein